MHYYDTKLIVLTFLLSDFPTPTVQYGLIGIRSRNLVGDTKFNLVYRFYFPEEFKLLDFLILRKNYEAKVSGHVTTQQQPDNIHFNLNGWFVGTANGVEEVYWFSRRIVWKTVNFFIFNPAIWSLVESKKVKISIIMPFTFLFKYLRIFELSSFKVDMVSEWSY